jgi:coatomer subunit alpha
LTAKNHGLTELADEILEEAGLSADDVADIKMPSSSKTASPPSIPVITETADMAWPLIPQQQNLFEKALTNGGLEALDGEEYAYHGNGDAAGKSTNAVLDQWADGEGLDDEVDEDGWDLDAVTSPQVHVGHGAAPEEAEEEEEIDTEGLGAGATPGPDEPSLWVRNSPLAADHVAAGSFETAMQLLNKQLGIVNFGSKDIKELFMETYRSAHVWLSPVPSLPPLQLHIRRNAQEVTSSSRALPVKVRSLADIKGQLLEGMKLVSGNKLEDARDAFKDVLRRLLIVVLGSDQEAKEVGRFFVNLF